MSWARKNRAQGLVDRGQPGFSRVAEPKTRKRSAAEGARPTNTEALSSRSRSAVLRASTRVRGRREGEGGRHRLVGEGLDLRVRLPADPAVADHHAAAGLRIEEGTAQEVDAADAAGDRQGIEEQALEDEVVAGEIRDRTPCTESEGRAGGQDRVAARTTDWSK